MATGNFDGEIKDAVSTHSKAMPGKNSGAGKPSPNPTGGMKQSSAATAKMPPAHGGQQFKPPQPQANQQQGLQQATDEPFVAHMQQGGPSMPQSSGLHQAHGQIVAALAQRDMLKGQ